MVNIEEGLKEIGENNDFSPAFIPKEVKDAGLNYIPGEFKNSKDKFSYLAGWALLVKR